MWHNNWLARKKKYDLRLSGWLCFRPNFQTHFGCRIRCKESIHVCRKSDFKTMWFPSTGFSSAAPTSSRRLHTRQRSKASSATWTWVLRAPESCWCPEFDWPKRRCRDFCPAVVPQVQKPLKHAGFYFIWCLWSCDVTLLLYLVSPGQRAPLVAASVGPYGAFLHNGSEYTGDYAKEMSVEVSVS